MPQLAAPITLVLLPGLDGTGDLFEPLLGELPPQVKPQVVCYPADQVLTYTELLSCVMECVPAAEPHIVLAESFSTPLAVTLAARRPANLRGLIICAGFVTNPARGWLRFLQALASPFWFRFGLPAVAVNHFLIGRDAPTELRQRVVQTIRRVPPAIIAARLQFVARCDVSRELAEVSVPLLYLRATDDRLVRRDSLEGIRNEKPGTHAVEVSGPHFLLQREARKAAEVITDFIRRRCS